MLHARQTHPLAWMVSIDVHTLGVHYLLRTSVHAKVQHVGNQTQSQEKHRKGFMSCT